MSGTPEGVELGVVQKPGQITGHIQNPYVDAPGMMSVPDLQMVPKGSLSFINAGENTTFYIGADAHQSQPGLKFLCKPWYWTIR